MAEQRCGSVALGSPRWERERPVERERMSAWVRNEQQGLSDITSSALRWGPDAGLRRPRGGQVLRLVGHDTARHGIHQSPMADLMTQFQSIETPKPKQICARYQNKNYRATYQLQNCFRTHLLIHNGYGVKLSQSQPQRNCKLNKIKKNFQVPISVKCWFLWAQNDQARHCISSWPKNKVVALIKYNFA